MRIRGALFVAGCAAFVGGCQTIGRSAECFELCEDPVAVNAFQQAGALIAAGDVAAAVPLLRTVAETCPDFVAGHEAYQDSAAGLGDLSESEMRSYYAQFADQADWPLLPYLTSRLSDNNRDRLTLLKEAIRRDDSFFRAYRSIADIYRQLDRTGEALDALDKAIQAKPDDFESNLAIAEVLVQLGRFKESAQHYRVCDRLSPGNQRVRKDYLAILIYQLGELDTAERILSASLGHDDQDIEILMDKAAIAWLRKEHLAALQTYQQILRVDGDQPEAVLNIGNLYYQPLAQSVTDGKQRYWPKARLAYIYYLENCRAGSGFDQLDRWLGIPIRLREIDALLGKEENLQPSLSDLTGS